MKNSKNVQIVLDFIKENWDTQNLSGIARVLDMRPADLRKAVLNLSDAKGQYVEISAATQTSMMKWAKKLKADLKNLK